MTGPIRDAVERAIARADAPDAASVFVTRFDRQARETADGLDSGEPSARAGALRGMLVTIKDNLDVAGLPTTAGSRLLRNAAPAPQDAVALQRLRQAGAVVLGRTNMTEFAFSGLGLNPHYGTPANPAFQGEPHIPGGSSSGAAVSVALGIAPAAIGTDTGGSVRIPAAFCGLVGFKPTAAAVSREGVLPLSTTLDGVGVIARDVADCAAVFDVIRDTPGPSKPEPAPRPIRLGLVENYVTQGVTPEVRAAVDAAVAALTDGGVSVEPVLIPELDEIPDMTREAAFSPYESFAWHERFLARGRASEYDPRVVIRILAGSGMTGAAYAQLRSRRTDLILAVGRRTASFDALIWPTTPITAPTLASLADDAAYHAANALVLRNPTVANLLDGCAISLPCPGDGPPVGLTLAASGGRDDHLLGVAARVAALLKGR